MIRCVTVGGKHTGMRLDTFLTDRYSDGPGDGHSRSRAAAGANAASGQGVNAAVDGMSRSAVQKLITRGWVRVNGQRAKPGVRLKLSDRIEIQWMTRQEPRYEAEPLFLPILFEDDDLLLVNKPPGMVVHPAAGNHHGTLINALLHHCPDLRRVGEEQRPGIVHRLDKETSGAMVVAKNEAAFGRIARQFKDRSVAKEYVAFVWGKVKTGRGTIDRPIGRHRSDRKRMSSLYALPRQRAAVTLWELERVFCLDPLIGPQGWISLLRVRPHTGRTHQIRVHLSDQGHPVVEDRLYGKKKRGPEQKDGIEEEGIAGLPRQGLHAERLQLTHPRSGERLDVTAPWFPDMVRFLDFLRERDWVSRCVLKGERA